MSPRGRLLVTLALVGGYLLLGLVPLPVASAGGLFPGLGTPWRMGSLGPQPFISAALVVELVALVWYRDRRQEPAFRAGLMRWVLGLGLVLAAAQALGVALSASAGQLLNGGFLAVSAMLLGGAALAWATASLIRRHGLGEGFAWLALVQLLGVVFGPLAHAFESFADGSFVPAMLLMLFGGVATAFVGTIAAFARFGAPGPGLPYRPPVSGIWPWTLAFTVGGWVGILASDDGLGGLAAALVAALWTPVAALVWHWRLRGELRSQHRSPWRRSIVLTALALAVLSALDTWLFASWTLVGFCGLSGVVLATALFLDLRAEWRARAAGLVLLEEAWDVHAARDAQAWLGPGVEPAGLHYRSLTRIFGVLIPIRLFGEPRDED